MSVSIPAKGYKIAVIILSSMDTPESTVARFVLSICVFMRDASIGALKSLSMITPKIAINAMGSPGIKKHPDKEMRELLKKKTAHFLCLSFFE